MVSEQRVSTEGPGTNFTPGPHLAQMEWGVKGIEILPTYSQAH